MGSKLNTTGFSLFELLIVMTIVGILGAGMAAWLYQRQGPSARTQLINKINALTRYAWQQTVMTNAIHRVVFDLKNKQVFVEQEIDREKKEYKKIDSSRTVRWPERFVIKQFFIEGLDEISKAGAGQRTTEIFFYVVPGGLAQRVTINIVESKQNNKKYALGLVINPFNAQFALYDSFQK